MAEIKITQDDHYCTFSTFGVTPENPSGTKIVYTLFREVPQNGKKNAAAELVVCDIDGKNPFKLCDVSKINAHNGARAIWIDDRTLLYWDDSHTKVRTIDGTLLYAKYGYPGESTYKDNMIVYHPDYADSSDGIYTLNTTTGDYTKIVSHFDFASFKHLMDGPDHPGDWRITHPRFNRTGDKIACALRTKSHYLFICNADGSNIQFFGKKPMHWDWYDERSIIGQDNQGLDGLPSDLTARIWDLSGRWIEDAAGVGNHLAYSPDGAYLASDSWYHTSPIVLKWYKKGSLEGEPIFSSPYASAVWENGGAHVNPAFSRDGSRIYYTKPVGPNLVHGYYYQLTV
ncbi:PD40 domain-containing protein [Paenibacillus koleovorans]|uniref:PD40 domain-containing protein n=1 Tax=Paenibacillus koleovorans TaxID=121608 RepID=UPI000FDA9B3B|nr:PD40 domain-containing protein [Paenibacillus koleovorans]